MLFHSNCIFAEPRQSISDCTDERGLASLVDEWLSTADKRWSFVALIKNSEAPEPRKLSSGDFTSENMVPVGCGCLHTLQLKNWLDHLAGFDHLQQHDKG